jgi:hypothetical protein
MFPQDADVEASVKSPHTLLLVDSLCATGIATGTEGVLIVAGTAVDTQAVAA